MIAFQIVQGAEAGRVFETGEPRATLGRTDANSVMLTDYHLSSEHGQVFSENGQFIYRDLRSTNGSIVERDGRQIPVDASCNYEIRVHDGDRLLLGDSKEPVIVRLRIDDADPPTESRVLATRRITQLPELAGKFEADPGVAAILYQASKRLSGRVELSEALEAVADAVFEAVPKATHVSILMRSEVDTERFTVACSRERAGNGQQADHGAPVHASRAVLGLVLKKREAVLVANAKEELGGSESIAAGQIMSTLAVPLWNGMEMHGVIQADNRASAGIFLEKDLDILMVLAAQAALALENARLVSRLRAAGERLSGENVYLKDREQQRRFADIIGDSTPMRDVLTQLEKVMDTRATVCIQGETGTGKELIASAIHYQGRRNKKLFVAQNCAALPDNLLESELFGHKKGAFTGADTDKKGLFELADGGTLFLDEIGEMSLGLQAKLLRVLQEGMVRPLGSTQERATDARIICATNRNLTEEVENGNFRQDLYYRVMVFPIELPPLRERTGDIGPLVQHFLKRYTTEYNKAVAGFSQATLDVMSSYSWPGNIRELENEVQRLIIQCDAGSFFEPGQLSPQLRKVEGTLSRIAPKKGTLKEMMVQVERWLLQEALRENDNNKTKTATALGITREGLHKKLAKLKL